MRRTLHRTGTLLVRGKPFPVVGGRGTREFFQMKHRILEFLVKEMGFTYFAI